MVVRALSVHDAYHPMASSDHHDSSIQMYGEAQPTATDIIMAKEYLNQVRILGCHEGVARWEGRDYISSCTAEANIMLLYSLSCRRPCCPLTRFAVSVRPTSSPSQPSALPWPTMASGAVHVGFGSCY